LLLENIPVNIKGLTVETAFASSHKPGSESWVSKNNVAIYCMNISAWCLSFEQLGREPGCEGIKSLKGHFIETRC
jgi:hypothetical protein